jgi:hypothetical protein
MRWTFVTVETTDRGINVDHNCKLAVGLVLVVPHPVTIGMIPADP